MIKKKALRKIIITTFVFFIVLTICMIPSKNKKDEKIYTYVDTVDVSVYLNNDYNQLTKVNFKVANNNLDKIIRLIINKLTISNDATIPNSLVQVIPENVKLEEAYVDEGIAYLDFSKEFLDISDEKIENIVESIIYSLFDIDKINGVSIYVEGKNISNLFDKNLPDIFTKQYGINKRVELKNLDDVSQVIVYYVSEIDNDDYYVPITKYVNDNRDKIKIIIDELSSNYIYESNLISLLDKNVELLNYEIINDEMILDFNNSIFIDKNDELEELVYSISYSVFANYDVKNVIFKAEGKEFMKKSAKDVE